MRKVLKWAGIVLGSLVGMLAIAFGVMILSANARLNKNYNIQVESVTIPTDAASLERGKHIVTSTCVGCHGGNLAGRVMIDAPIAYIESANLTGGKGGIGAAYSDADFIRAIRHGVDNQGKPLLIMPARAFYYFSDTDLGAIIAYVKSVSPVDREMKDYTIPVLGKMLISAGKLDIISAEGIDHTAPRPTAPAVGESVAYGDYLVRTRDCRACHGADLTGGSIPGSNPPIVAPSLAPAGDLGSWKASDFITTLRSGVRPNGVALKSDMPWKEFSQSSDAELQAMWVYLQSLQPRASSK
jgi:mono/diheme cytochrome c family protein